MTGAVQTAQQLLTEHRPYLDITATGQDDLTCYDPAVLKFCGWQWVSDDPVECSRQHAAHQADTLRAAGLLADTPPAAQVFDMETRVREIEGRTTPPPGLVEALRDLYDAHDRNGHWREPGDGTLLRHLRALLDQYANSTGNPS